MVLERLLSLRLLDTSHLRCFAALEYDSGLHLSKGNAATHSILCIGREEIIFKSLPLHIFTNAVKRKLLIYLSSHETKHRNCRV